MTPADFSSLLSTGTDTALPVERIAQEEWEKRKSAAGNRAAQWFSWHAAPNGEQVIPLSGADGAPARVLWVSDRQDPWAMARLAAALPDGRYRPENFTPGMDGLIAWLLAHYRFDRFRDMGEAPSRILCLEKDSGFAQALRLAGHVALARDMVNTPAGHMGPEALAGAADAMARDFDAQCTVTAGDDLLKANLPAIHAVGRAGGEAPRLIDLRWSPKSGAKMKLALIGKGVCFDTGGLNIKSGAGMRNMKKDMGGAAVALSLARAIMDAGLPVDLRCLVPAVENGIAAGAYRPGDIIDTRKGLSVEIGNTDAEGRVVLSDALALAAEEKPDIILDFATLTGAARVALGPDLPAFYAGDDGLADAMMKAGRGAGDPLWRMPLWDAYEEMLASTVADTGNMADSPFAGSVTAALFLRKFVERPQAWGHFDIFCWTPKDKPGQPQGGEAPSLRAVYTWLTRELA